LGFNKQIFNISFIYLCHRCRMSHRRIAAHSDFLPFTLYTE
jgi:hypothetical protein